MAAMTGPPGPMTGFGPLAAANARCVVLPYWLLTFSYSLRPRLPRGAASPTRSSKPGPLIYRSQRNKQDRHSRTRPGACMCCLSHLESEVNARLAAFGLL